MGGQKEKKGSQLKGRPVGGDDSEQRSGSDPLEGAKDCLETKADPADWPGVRTP